VRRNTQETVYVSRPTSCPYIERRQEFEGPKPDGRARKTCEKFDDGRALFTAVVELSFEGVVAKNHSSLYRPNDHGWVKIKNPDGLRDAERETMARKHTRSRSSHA
jgi:ATP-dependent DNA ligase